MENSEYLVNFTPPSDFEEPVSFPLKCWQNVCLSDIWIPAHLLLVKDKSSSSEQVYQGIFHTLDNERPIKRIKSFSVYNDSSEEEIYESDSDEEILFSLENNKGEESENCIGQLLEKKSIYDKMLFEQNDYNENTEFCNMYENVVANAEDEILKSTEAVENILINDLPDKMLFEQNDYNENTEFCNMHENAVPNTEDKLLKSTEAVENILIKDLPDKMLFEQKDYNENTEFCNIHENVVANKDDEFLKPTEAVENILINDLPTQAIAIEYDSDKNNFTRNKNDIEELKNTPDGEISLHEILDKTPAINFKQFSFDYIKKDNVQSNNTIEKKIERSAKQNSKKMRQLKKKASKIISLNELVANESDQDKCCNEFFNHIMSKKDLDINDGLSLNNKMQFPELGIKKTELINSDNSDADNFESELKSVSVHSSQDENKQCMKLPFKDDDSILGKFVIENIPLHASEEDINNILMGYGEIKSFSLKPDGMFHKAFIVMNLAYDIEWIVECLNESDPFGASSETLKCYVVDSCN